jgi:transposase-like protein
VAATTDKLAELLSSDLSCHDAAVLMIDGIVFHECCCVVALLITADGTKIPVGVWEGDTENTTVVKHLLADLVARGLRFEQGLLLVIDGGKALAAGIKRVFGKCAVVQRCVLHKRRDVADYLAPELARRIDCQLKAAFNDPDAERGLKIAKGLATQLEREHPSAAGSLREGLDDMFTVRRLGASDLLARSLSCTNAIESMISTVRLVSSGVKRWRDPAMVRRWVGTGMIEARRSFRRIKGSKDMKQLVDAVRAEVARRVAADQEGSAVTPTNYDQAAA